MIQQKMSQDNGTESANRFSALHAGDGLVNLSAPEDDDLRTPLGDRLTTGADSVSGEELKWAGLLDPPSKTRQSRFTPCSRMTICRFVETKFIPEYIAFKRTSGRLFYHSMLKHVLIPEEVDCMFRTNLRKRHKSLKTIPEWPYLGNLRFCDVGPDDISRLLSAALAHGYSIQTVKHIRNVIAAIFSHAMHEQYFMGNNPVSLVKPPRVRRKQVVALTPAQVIEAVSIMQYPEREMTLICVFTGMSPAEITGLEWGQVNLSDMELNEDGMRVPPRTICVRKRWYRGKSECVQGNCVRDLSITAPLLLILKRLRRRSYSIGPEDCVLVTRTGTPINQDNVMTRRLRPIARQLGVPSLSWQAIRRTHEVLAAELDKEFGLSALAIST